MVKWANKNSALSGRQPITKGEKMSDIQTGGQAFPSTNHGMMISMGMTLRDYFAAKAMQGLLAGALESSDTGLIARDCYAMADAMIKAREAK
jgi:hypothetical protein